MLNVGNKTSKALKYQTRPSQISRYNLIASFIVCVGLIIGHHQVLCTENYYSCSGNV